MYNFGMGWVDSMYIPSRLFFGWRGIFREEARNGVGAVQLWVRWVLRILRILRTPRGAVWLSCRGRWILAGFVQRGIAMSGMPCRSVVGWSGGFRKGLWCLAGFAHVQSVLYVTYRVLLTSKFGSAPNGLPLTYRKASSEQCQWWG